MTTNKFLLWAVIFCSGMIACNSDTTKETQKPNNQQVETKTTPQSTPHLPTEPTPIKTHKLGTLQFQMQGAPVLKVEEFIVDAYTSLTWNTPASGVPALAMAFKGPKDQSGFSVMLNGPATAQDNITGSFPITLKAPSRVQIAMRWGEEMENSFTLTSGDAEIEQLSRDGIVKLMAKGVGIFGNTKDPSQFKENVPCTFSLDCQLRDVIVDGEYLRKDGESL